jgi:apolipoprotein N-acyltransferase
MTAPDHSTARPGARLLAQSGVIRFAALAVLGVIAGLGQEPFGWWWATVPALAAALHLAATERSPRAAFADLWSLGFGYFAFTMHWLVEPFLVDAARHGWMAPFALVFMAAGLALFWGAAGLLARRIGPTPFALAIALTLAEATRSLVLTGLPWALAGHIWIDTPLAQFAALAGPHALTLLTFTLAATLAPPRNTSALPLAAVAAAWVALDPGPAPAPAPGAPVIRLVQPNIPQDEKWDPDLIPEQVNRIMRLSAGPDDAPVPALVVWPETTLPWLLEEMPDLLELAADATLGAPIAMGVQRGEGGLYYNTLALVDGAGQVIATYDKHHLVPFGEYIPLGDLLGRWGIRGLAASDGAAYAAGPGPAVMDVPGIGTVMPLICYEGIFAEEVNAMPARANLLLLVTNDAWFGENVGPYQHLAQGRLRAIEQGLPMVRVANTGVSALIDPQGRVLGSIPLGQEGVLDLPLPAPEPPTPYTIWGDWPLLLLLVAVALALSMRRMRDSG